MTKTYTIEVQEDKDGECFVELPAELLAETGWIEGDTLNWEDNKDGTFTLNKVAAPKPETEWVLVEAISTFRERYMVEVPKGKALWALDTVSCEEAKEFSQEHLGEQIISHRVVTKEEALALCDTDNDYTAEWEEENKLKNFFTPWEEDYYE